MEEKNENVATKFPDVAERERERERGTTIVPRLISERWCSG